MYIFIRNLFIRTTKDWNIKLKALIPRFIFQMKWWNISRENLQSMHRRSLWKKIKIK